MSAAKVRVAAVGLGNRTCKYLSYLMRNRDHAELVAVVDTDPSKIRKAQEMYSLPSSCCFNSLDGLLSSGLDADACSAELRRNAHTPQSTFISEEKTGSKDS